MPKRLNWEHVVKFTLQKDLDDFLRSNLLQIVNTNNRKCTKCISNPESHNMKQHLVCVAPFCDDKCDVRFQITLCLKSKEWNVYQCNQHSPEYETNKIMASEQALANKEEEKKCLKKVYLS